MPILLRGIEGIQAYRGFNLGKSSWIEISQEMINGYACATDDWDWPSVDKERARRGPFGKTVAQSYLLMGMVMPMLNDICLFEGIEMGVHHGLNQLRFPAPAPVNSSVRLDATLKSTEPARDGLNLVFDCAMECDATDKLVLHVEFVYQVRLADRLVPSPVVPG